MPRPDRSASTPGRLGPLLLVASLVLCGCWGSGARLTQTPPAKVERIGGGLTRVVLSARAADRLGIQTARVRHVRGAAHSTEIPYAAVLYRAGGNAVTYTNPGPLVYVRRPIVISHIAGGWALLAAGPPAGTLVVTVGGDELLGTEEGVQG